MVYPFPLRGSCLSGQWDRPTQGGVSANIDALARRQDDGILDLTAKKIRTITLISAGRARRGLRLLQQSPCTTSLVEKGHAAAAVVNRCHKKYGPAQLRARCLLELARPVLRPCPTQAKLTKLRARFLEKLRESRGIKFTARNAFASSIMPVCKKAIPQGGGSS